MATRKSAGQWLKDHGEPERKRKHSRGRIPNPIPSAMIKLTVPASLMPDLVEDADGVPLSTWCLRIIRQHIAATRAAKARKKDSEDG